MTSGEAAAWVQGGAAALTLVVAGIAAYFTKEGPRRAAELAEALRLQNDRLSARRNQQLLILQVLMVQRGNILGADAAQAVNAVPVAFGADANVMEAYRALCQDVGPYTPRKLDLYRTLVVAIADHVGLDGGVRSSDFMLGYWITPNPVPEKRPETGGRKT